MTDDDLVYRRGNLVTREDTFKPVACSHCGEMPVRRDDVWADDACIVDLPGVVFACCGHGVAERIFERLIDTCYVVFDDGLSLYGNAARGAMGMLGGDPAPAEPGTENPYPETHGLASG